MKPFFVSTEFLCPHLSWVLLHFTLFSFYQIVKLSKSKLTHYLVFHSQHHWASLVTQTVKNLPAMRESWVRSLGQEDPLEKGMALHSVFLPGEIHGQRRLLGYSAWSRKESDTAEQLALSLSQHLAKYIVKTKHYLLYECFPITFSGTIVWIL